MSRSLTNNTQLNFQQEVTAGVTVGAAANWFATEPNSIGSFGATITTVARSPISRQRQNRKGTVVDLDSVVDFDGDLTLDHYRNFAEGFAFATATFGDVVFRGGAVTGTGITVPALSAAQADKMELNTLVFTRGYITAANNGLKVLTADPVTSGTELVFAATVVEGASAANANATIEVAGIRAATSDLVLDVTAGVGTLDSTLLDFTTLNLLPGQMIHIGGLTTGEQFSAGAGYGRIVSIAATQVILDKLDATLLTDPGTGDTVDLLFGNFIRNVATNNADFLERSYSFEMVLDGLDSGAPMYEYASGNFCNSLALNMALADKATLSFGFIGMTAAAPVVAGSRLSTDVLTLDPVETAAFNTTSDCTRLTIAELDETGITTDFKSVTITLTNNVSPEKSLCNLGAQFMNFGNFEINIEAQMIFTNVAVATAVRENRTISLDFGIKNDDGAIFIDIPSATMGGGDKEFPINESVLINTAVVPFQDPTLGTSIGISLLPVVP